MSLLIDEACRPTLRERIGLLLSTCTTADIAVGHIRLAALDLSGPEVERVEQCRILLGRLEARALTGFGHQHVVTQCGVVDDVAGGATRNTLTDVAGDATRNALADVAGGGTRNTLTDAPPRALLAFLESGRVQVRSAGLGAWSPDFSVYRGLPDGDVCLLGAHYFREPPSTCGPSFTMLLKDRRCIAMVGARFDALWERSHDVLEPIVSAVHRAQSCPAS